MGSNKALGCEKPRVCQNLFRKPSRKWRQLKTEGLSGCRCVVCFSARLFRLVQREAGRRTAVLGGSNPYFDMPMYPHSLGGISRQVQSLGVWQNPTPVERWQYATWSSYFLIKPKAFREETTYLFRCFGPSRALNARFRRRAA